MSEQTGAKIEYAVHYPLSDFTHANVLPSRASADHLARSYDPRVKATIVALVPLPLLDALLALDADKVAGGWLEVRTHAANAIRALRAAVERGE